MYHVAKAGKSFINRSEYRDKVLGCWTGKNIGGTLGTPFEGKKTLNDITFYTQDLKGNPAPNDDLDLQLAWLDAVEEHGLYHVNERVLGEYWLQMVCGPWNEYGTAKFNMRNGFLPPVSGLCNNEAWKNSNGAWIRSEIWACLFPGEPEEAARYAWFDACVDHTGDGIYAEIFTATLEAAAFVENDLHRLIQIALAHIPEDCRVARSVKLVLDCYQNKEDWKTARNKVLEDCRDLGWFQAPGNVAFVVIGLLYGEGDFGKSICTAVNCGDDTDCTGATCGAVLGILKGRKGLPKEWIEPIGESIRTVAVTSFTTRLPATLDELTDRVMIGKHLAEIENPTLVHLTDGPTMVDQDLKDRLLDNSDINAFLSKHPSNQMCYDLPYGTFFIQYDPSPVVSPNSTLKLRLTFGNMRTFNCALNIQWHLPEGWYFDGANQQILMGYGTEIRSQEATLHVGNFSHAIEYVPVEFHFAERNYPTYLAIPFQCLGTTSGNPPITQQQAFQEFSDTRNHIFARINAWR